ncbi:MAG: sigma 54-interacting transcriptional regulator [Acidobacteriota bacterium]
MAKHKLTNHRTSAEATAAGTAAKEDSRYDEAIAHFQSALRMRPAAEEEARIRCQLAETYEIRGLHREQLSTLEKYASPEKLAQFSQPLRIILKTQLGRAYSYNNDSPRGIGLLNQALSLAYHVGNDKEIGDCHQGLSLSYINISEHRIARDYCDAALEHYRRLGGWREIALCYFQLSRIHFHEGDFKSSWHYANQMLVMIGDKTDAYLLGTTYHTAAIARYYVDPVNQPILSYLEKGIEYFYKTQNEPDIAVSYNTQAYLLMLSGDLNRAEKISRSAIRIVRNSSRLMYLGVLLDTLAQINLLQGNLQEADAILEEAKEIFSHFKQKNSKPSAEEIVLDITIGRKYLLEGNVIKAIEYLQKAVDISLSLKATRHLMDAQIWLSEALLSQGDIEAAIKIVEEMHAQINRHPNLELFGFLCRLDAKIAAAQNNFAAAIQWLEQSTSFFEIREYQYERAVNRILLASILEELRAFDESIKEVETALSIFEEIGAKLNAKEAIDFLNTLKKQAKTSVSPSQIQDYRQPSDLALSIDGFIAQRILRASISRKLLLHEIASITQAIAAAQAIVIFETKPTVENVNQTSTEYVIATALGLDEPACISEQEFINQVPQTEYARHCVYEFSDHHQCKFLLQVIEPQSERFKAVKVTLKPLLQLAEHSLELNQFKSNHQKPRVFNPEQMLAQLQIPGFICASRAMNDVLEQIQKIRSSNVTVLITGESGTGKELIARALHATSSRRAKKFLPFNCSAAPRELLESQLFGHRKGAFSGAMSNNPGIIKTAIGGTLFLDEIGDLPLDLQPKLLRFLQEGEILSLGDNEPEIVDVRIVAATNSNLEDAVAQGKFREDLFHRLNVIRIHTPPLRERREEIPVLVNHYLTVYQQESAKTGIELTEEALDLLLVYDWPGNVRQLCNELRRVVAYSDSGTAVSPDKLSIEIVKAGREIQAKENAASKPFAAIEVDGLKATLQEATDELERRMIMLALQQSSGNIAQAAKALGLSRMGLYLKMNRLNLER